MDSEIINALFGLFDQRVSINFPGKFLRPGSNFLESLIDWNRFDWHGAVADNPFPGRVNVFSGRKIHDGVSAPFGRPPHLFDLFLDTRCNSRIPYVSVDLHQKIPANNHRLKFWMIDVCGNDRPAPSDLIADKFSRDRLWNPCTPGIARVMSIFLGLFPPEVFPY